MVTLDVSLTPKATSCANDEGVRIAGKSVPVHPRLPTGLRAEAEASNLKSMGHTFAPGQSHIAGRTRIQLDGNGRRHGANLQHRERGRRNDLPREGFRLQRGPVLVTFSDDALGFGGDKLASSRDESRDLQGSFHVPTPRGGLQSREVKRFALFSALVALAAFDLLPSTNSILNSGLTSPVNSPAAFNNSRYLRGQ
jgi:hypothetical protein